MIRSHLLEILCCPETHRPLRLAQPPVIAQVNERIKAGRCKNRAGERVSESIVEALVTDDASVLYPVRNHVPILLVNEGISLGA